MMINEYDLNSYGQAGLNQRRREIAEYRLAALGTAQDTQTRSNQSVPNRLLAALSGLLTRLRIARAEA